MIDYQTYCQIRHLFTQKQLSLRQIARELKLGFHTVRKWARRESYKRAPIPKRRSKLDPFKGDIIRLLEQHEYSAQQIFQQLKELGYEGRTSILRAFVSEVRPKRRAAFLTLHFDPGQCAQVDWGCAGSVPVGSTHRRLSLFIMVLAYSRKMYLEFTLAETLEQKAREQKLFLRFLALCPKAPDYYQQLEQRRLNPKHHVQKIVALSELYGADAVARALEDAFTYQAFSCEYIANLLQQRQHPPEEPAALHLTRQQDLLELELPAPDLSLYDTKNFPDPSANP